MMTNRRKIDPGGTYRQTLDAPEVPPGLSARRAAVALGLNERTIRRAIAHGELTAVKRGGSYRIALADLERYAVRHERPGASRVGTRGSVLPPLLALPTVEPTLPPLPEPLSPFIGRRDDVATVSALLRDPTVRLVTLTGPGGIGKARLALETAAAMRDHFPDGVVFVDLAPVSRAELVATAISQGLGLKEVRSGDLRGRLRTFLRSKRLLLLLDNFEQVLDAAPLVAQVLIEAGSLTALVTSRVPLRVGGERQVPVPPLELPAGHAPLTPAALVASDAGRLFVERARAHAPSFAVDEASAPIVAEICARLDGLPLALELAASRTKALSPRELLTRLELRLPLLTGGARDAPARLRTMRDAIAWSYDLLTPSEQALFCRLSVFAGGFQLDAAGAVASASSALELGDIGFDLAVLDGVSSLLDQSLLIREAGADGLPRFRMLETIREFAAEQLAARAEADEWRRRHARYYLGLAHETSTSFRAGSLDATAAWDRLEAEHANFWAALAWLNEAGPAEDFVQLAITLHGFWLARSQYREGRTWLERALAKADQTPALDRAKVLVALGLMAMMQGELDKAEPFFAAGIPILRVEADSLDVAEALIWHGAMATHAGDYARAESLLEEALALAEASNDRHWGAAIRSRALANLGVAARCRGELGLAASRCEAALRRYRAQGLEFGVTASLVDLGDVARDQGDYSLALTRYRASLARIGERGDLRLVAETLAGVASAAAAWGHAHTAARLFGAAAALRERVGTVLILPADLAAQDRSISVVRNALGDQGFAVAWAEGWVLSRAQAEAEAASIHPPASWTPPPHTPDSGPELTRREGEVLRLLVQRRTDREIAEALFLSPRTVGWHVSAILSKLGVASRRQAAERAIQDGLV